MALREKRLATRPCAPLAIRLLSVSRLAPSGPRFPERIGFDLDAACRHSLVVRAHPGRTSWDVLSRPYGTGLEGMFTQDYVLGYSVQPSLRD